jgi:hypothetical protein
MATFQMSILGAASVPDATGRCFMEPYSIKATNDLFRHMVFVFNDPSSSEAHGIYGVFLIPQNYVGTPRVYPVWTSTATSGNVKWDFDYRAIGGDDTESLDQNSFQQQLTVTDAAPSATNERNTPSLSLTAGNLAAGDTVEFYLTREDGGGVDTMAAAATLHDLIFEYADA